MLPFPRGAVWQTLFLLCAVLFINEVRSEGRVVCYYTNWSVYRPGTAKFNPQNINPYLCTHLVYAFGGFTKDNQMKPFDKYQDIEQGGYAKFTGLKTYNKQLKTMIAIGGWNEASSRFSPLVASPERRQQFIKNILKFLRQNHFDGIDLDWEYPAHRAGGKPRDRDNYAQFVQELRAEFERESKKTGRPRLLLTMAVPAGIEHIDRGYDIPRLNKYLDWFNLLSYDFHSSHESSANHHAPLYSMEEESEYNYDTELNIDYSVKYYLKAGADRDKLVLGIPTYGRSYTLINEESTELGAPSEGPGEQGDATREKGYLAYYEICQNIKEDPEWTVVQPNPNAMGPYAFRRNQWVGYDDEDIVRKKAQYVVEHGLGGIMFWAIDNDDFRGTCTGKPYPLIEAAKEAMLEGLGLGINEVSKPSSQKKPQRSRSRENSSSTRNRIGAGEIVKSDQKRIQITTTAAPSTTIKLTEAEGSSLYIGGRTTTPPPPTTPDPGADFKCEEEGFFQHPRDCKKYFWCLDSGPSGLGIVAHQFTCPSGLYFNPSADSCDFARNVPCKIKKLTTPTPAISTTTTPRSTTASNRITAATSRNSFLRTTTRRPTTTTTTTGAPEEEEEEIEYVDEDETPTQIKDKDAEEDPKVIKELIELIRKVGGIEELEKHLQRKEDGSILLKEETSSAGVPTTQSTISKTLYDKVLSRPNTYNSFRNRLIKNAEQTKTAEITETEVKAQEEGRSSNSNSGGSNYSKYSSVVRSGNGRQGPQNAGIEKLPEFEGFLKEKKQYVTINRNRGASTHSQNDEEEVDEEDDEEKEETLKEESENKETADGNSVRKAVATSTPAYTSIRRSRPTTVKTDIEEESQKEINEMKNYATLSRYRGRFTTTPEPDAEIEDVVSTTKRYKYQERTRPTKFTTAFTNSEQPDADDDDTQDEDDDDGENEEDHENVMSHLTADNDSSTQKSHTTRTYASIGRRKTTTTPATPTETPTTRTRTTTKTNQLDTTISNEPTTPEPISTTTTISQKTRTPTPTNTPELITTSIDSIPITSTSTISSLSTTTVISSTSTPESGDNSDSLYDSTTLPPAVSSLSSVDTSEETLSDLSNSIKSLVQETASPTTESTGLDTTKQDTRNDLITTTAKTTTKTLTTTGTTDTDSHEGDDKVTTTDLNKHLTKPQYKFTTKTRNITTTTTNNSDNAISTKTTTTTRKENSNSDNDIDIANDNDQTSLNNESNQNNSSSNSLSSNSVNRGNSVKYTGGRRQQQQQQTELPFNRKSQIPTQQTYRTKSTTSRTTTIATDEFLGTVSSPRPFGFPKRRGRPTNAAEIVNETSSAIDKATNKKKYQPNRSRVTTTATTAATSNASNAQDDTNEPQTQLIDQVNELDEETTKLGTSTTSESTLSSSPAPTPRRIRVLKYRRPVGSTSTTTLYDSNNESLNNTTAITSVANNTDTTLDANLDSSSPSSVEKTSLDSQMQTHILETHTETSETLANLTPTKRFRKVIRKLIRPVQNRTADGESTLVTKTAISTFASRRRNGTRFGLNRSTTPQGVLENENLDTANKNESVSLRARGRSRFFRPDGSSTESAIRSINSRRRPTTTSTASTTVEEEEGSEEEEIDDVSNEEKVRTTTNVAYTDDSLVTEIEEDDLTAETDDDKSVNNAIIQSKTSNVEHKEDNLQKIRNKIKQEQADGDRDTGIVSTRLTTLLENKANVKANEEGVQETYEEESELQQIRNKVKLEQTDGNKEDGVVSIRLKNLLKERNSDTTKEEHDDSTDLQKLRDKVKLEQANGDQDKGVVSTRLKKLLSDKASSARTTNNLDENKATVESKKDIDSELNAVPSPFANRRPYVPSTRIKTTDIASEVNSAVDLTDSTTARPNLRPTFRRKLIAKRPYTPPKVALANVPLSEITSTTAKPRSKYTRTKFGKFHPFNAATGNTGEGFVRTDARDSLLPGTNQFKSQNKQNEDGEGDYDEYDDEGDEVVEGNEKEQPVVPSARPTTARRPGIFSRPAILRKPIEYASKEQQQNGDDENYEDGDDGEDDEESEDGEQEESLESELPENGEAPAKINSPSPYRPKDNRKLPGARPGLPTSTGSNFPFNPNRNRFSPTTSTSNNRFGNTGRSTKRPRVVNRPSGVAAPSLTLKPVAQDYERSTLPTDIKPAPFIPTNTHTYERKYNGPSTTESNVESNVDNSLIEDLNIEALSARNKKIFDINSKKHTTLKPKILIPTIKTSPTEQQNTETENDDETNVDGQTNGYVTTTPSTPLPNQNTDTVLTSNSNEISSQDGQTTTLPPATTLLHVFTVIDDDGQTILPPTASDNQIPLLLPERAQPKHKVIEINRIVEITSKEDKLRRTSKSNHELKNVGTTSLRVESLPHLEQLGEISVVKYVHLVDGSDIVIDSHSTVTDYTPTEPTISKTSAPVRNSLPDESTQVYAQLNSRQEASTVAGRLQERYGKSLMPEVLREAVETSTIALEGLFDSARQGKELNNADNTVLDYGLGENTAKPTTVSDTTASVLVTDTTTLTYGVEIVSATTPSSTNNNVEIVRAITPATLSLTTWQPDTFTVVSAALKETTVTNTESSNQISDETTTADSITNIKATTVPAALFPTYVRPIVPLLRPESNESSPLVISIANLDKVILSKVMKASSEAKSSETAAIDSNAEFSSHHAAIVRPPTFNTLEENNSNTQSKSESDAVKAFEKVEISSSVGSVSSTSNANSNAIVEVSNNNSSLSNTSGSRVSETVSFSSETNVVHKKKSRKHKARKFKKSQTNTTTNASKVSGSIIETTTALGA